MAHAWGPSLSPAIADIFMKNSKKLLDSSVVTNPKPGCWYVHNTFSIWPHGNDTAHMLQKYLNNQHNDIKFTMETESKDSPP